MVEKTRDVLSEFCRGCHGIWIDYLTLETRLTSMRGPASRTPLAEFLTMLDSAETEWSCPRCASSLFASEEGGITIEWCNGCRGIFLDSDELMRISQWDARKVAERRRSTIREFFAAALDLLHELGEAGSWDSIAEPERERRKSLEALWRMARQKPDRPDDAD